MRLTTEHLTDDVARVRPSKRHNSWVRSSAATRHSPWAETGYFRAQVLQG
jgi:hypothetical protein